MSVVVCVLKVPNNGNSTAPCSTVGTDRYVPSVVNAFVVDPSMEPVLTSIQVVNLGIINYTQAAEAFAASFVLVLTLWLFSKKIGVVLSLLKSKS